MNEKSNDVLGSGANPRGRIWPAHQPAEVIDRVIVEHWLETQLAMLGTAPRSPGAGAGPSLRPSS